ncbi:sugar transferase [uncultured Kordia sp.]|uniref:sugar transferase n=1 Tax=uncultured Kordia sp. TaxID=507699 RepID=UPI002611AFDC|nr:sugar transferase [uncultured Kordia sp.]
MIGKRIFDVVLSFVLLVILFLPICILWIVTSISFQSNGFFLQTRIGQHGKPFTIYKYKTLFESSQKTSKWGAFLRKTKIDELPQLINILKGNMSFVGPRPDVPGYYDILEGENRKILKLKPGITSEAALKYISEEQLLASQENPKQYNDQVIFPDKIKMNLYYYHTRSFLVDLKILLKTIQKLV